MQTFKKLLKTEVEIYSTKINMETVRILLYGLFICWATVRMSLNSNMHFIQSTPKNYLHAE